MSRSRKPDHDRIRQLPLSAIQPAPENDKIYRPINPEDSNFGELVDSIKKHGIGEPLIVSEDRFIVSGHRRFAAAKAAGLKDVPCIIRDDLSRTKDLTGFVAALADFNTQREKSFDEKLRETVIGVNPRTAYRALLDHREERARIKARVMELGDARQRSEISAAKAPFLAAIKVIIDQMRSYWPLSDRQIHYQLLNDPPLIHASKPNSQYRNTLRCYKSLVDLLTRARLECEIDMASIADETRPVMLWRVYQDVKEYLVEQTGDLFLTYRRNLLASQPNHIEIVVEKNTVRSIVEKVAEEFCIPVTSGRGYCSLPPRDAMANRSLDSGKDKLILLILSDHDPDGVTIARSLAQSLRDDFAVVDVEAVRVALTPEQVKEFKLTPGLEAKRGSATRKAFVEEYGPFVYELEALAPEDLQQLTRQAILSVLDQQAFQNEVEQEKKDATELEARRRIILDAMKK